MIDSALICAAARQCIDTPFVHQGRRVGTALDCAGVVVHVAAALGLAYEDRAGYSARPHGWLIESVLDDQPCLEQIPLAVYRDGDVLLMRFIGEPQHLGIWTGSTLIHAYSQVGRCVEHALDRRWERRIVRAYRFVEAG